MKHKNPKKDFNMIVVGTGGQGQIILLQIVARAALEEGYDVKPRSFMDFPREEDQLKFI